MKLIYAKYGIELQLIENQVNVLVIENPYAFSDFLHELLEQIDWKEGDLLLSDGDTVLPLTKNVIFIDNPLTVNCNEKRIITKLYKEISDIVKADMYEKYTEINTQIISFLEKVLSSVPYHLDIDVGIDVTVLLKAYDVKMLTEDVDPLEILIDYLRAYSSVCGIRIFVTLNLKYFFTQEQIQQLYEFCFYEKIFLIDLEGQKKYIIEAEKYVIIDQDLCLIESENN